jgi:hypothetical protein
MSIQIIDGFQVNTALPIDNRIVASGSAARNAISYKYEGLRVFDTSNSIPYVWINGTWSSENASGVLASGTTTNYIPKLNGTNVVGNSVIYQSGSNIGVNTTSPSTVSGETTTLHVNGGIIANKFQGNGYLITNIDGNKINNGSIYVNGASSSIVNGSTGQVLLSGTSYTSWSNQNQLSVGTASNAISAITSNNVVVSNNSTNVTNYITFVSATGSTSTGIKANAGLSYNPSTNILNTTGDIYMTNTNGYVIRGTRFYQQSGIGYTSGSATIAQVVVPSSSAITVEVTFTGGIKQISGLSVVGSQLRSAKYVAAYTTNGSGVITQSGSTNTILNVSSLGTGSVVIYSGSIDISTSSTIKFNQSWTGPITGNGVVKATVDYKITICSI